MQEVQAEAVAEVVTEVRETIVYVGGTGAGLGGGARS